MTKLEDWGLRPGPFEEHPWPERLKGRVTTVGPAPRIHGYDVQADLAQNYSFSEVTLLALTGELPADDVGRAFQVALVFLTPAPVSEAPANAATLAQMAAARPNCVLAVGAVALSEQAKFIVAQHAVLLEWLGRQVEADSPFPEAFRAQSPDERAEVTRLRALLPSGFAASALDADPTLMASLIAVLYQCGLRHVQQLESAIMLARLCTVAAEAFSTKRGTYRDYPFRLPEYLYTGAKDHG